MNELTFLSTVSVTHFLKSNDATKLDVIKNPKTDKLFFTTDSGLTGKVSTKGYDKEPMISECKDAEENTFFMLHSRGEQVNVVDTITV